MGGGGGVCLGRGEATKARGERRERGTTRRYRVVVDREARGGAHVADGTTVRWCWWKCRMHRLNDSGSRVGERVARWGARPVVTTGLPDKGGAAVVVIPCPGLMSIHRLTGVIGGHNPRTVQLTYEVFHFEYLQADTQVLRKYSRDTLSRMRQHACPDPSRGASLQRPRRRSRESGVCSPTGLPSVSSPRARA